MADALLQPKTTCEVCSGDHLVPVLYLGRQPLCDDLIVIGSDAVCETYPVELLGCPTCYTVHQKYQVSKTTLFPESYHYRAALTRDVLDGMDELVALAKQEAGGDLMGCHVLDVGCNDGSLLSAFRKEGATTIGVEPTGAAADAQPKVHTLFKRFFDYSAAEAVQDQFPQLDFITFTNVFAHISDLDELLGALKLLIGPKTKIIVENHYLGAVIDRAQFDTFYHEHPRTYSQKSLEVIAERLGLIVSHVDFPARYNGNIRVVMSRGAIPVASKPDEETYLGQLSRMKSQIEAGKNRFFETIKPFVEQHGPLPAKAFPGRAAIIINSFGIDENIIAATYERPGSQKIGHYVPGTRIPILDEGDFFASADAPAMVNLAWHIRDEIHSYMRSRGFEKPIIDVFAP